MASARSCDPTDREPNGLRRQAIVLLCLSVPYMIVGWLAYGRSFMSDEHARLVSNALVTLDLGRTELIGFVYPPLPFLLLLPWPHPLAATILTAIMGGAVVLTLWSHVGGLPFPLPARVALVLAVVMAPSSIFIMTQSLVETLALLLLVFSWSSFLEFVREGNTRSGFAAGLALGAALFVSQYALLYAALYVLLAPTLLVNKQPKAEQSIALVLLFPVVVSSCTWAYVSWAFTGDPLHFLRDAGASLYSSGVVSHDQLVLGWPLAIRSSLRDLAASPLFLVVAALVGFKHPSRLPILILPIGVITAVRALGLVYPDHFAVATYGVTALIALRSDSHRMLWPVLMAAAVMNVAAGLALPMQGEMGEWGSALKGGRAADAGHEERAIGVRLATLATRSVLTDDRIAYRLIARTGSARPFLLPPDSSYKLAEGQPARFVSHILVPSQPLDSSDRIGALYPKVRPFGFDKTEGWTNWQLYGRASISDSGSILVAGHTHSSPTWLELLRSQLSWVKDWLRNAGATVAQTAAR